MCFCWIRRRQREDAGLGGSANRGEYRRVASRFTADAFDDALDDDDLDGFVDDDYDNDGDDNDNGYASANGAGKHVIEMSEIDNGRLSLKEVNG